MRGGRGVLDGGFSVRKNVTGFRDLFSGDQPQVRFLEGGWVLEAVAEEAVEGDVSDPDEGEGCGLMPVLGVTDEQEGQSEGEGVGEVVGCGADAGVDEVTEHEEVGREEEEREEEPAVVEMLVGEDGEGEDDGFFGAEKDGGAGQHEFVIRDWWGRFFDNSKNCKARQRQRRAARTARSAIEADAPSAPFG